MDRPEARRPGHLPQGVGDEPVDSPLDPLRKPLGGQLHDRDRALRMFCCAAHSACEPFDSQGRGADPVGQFPQIRERPLGGEVGIGQPGRRARSDRRAARAPARPSA